MLCLSDAKLSWQHLKGLKYKAVISQSGSKTETTFNLKVQQVKQQFQNNSSPPTKWQSIQR